MQFRLKGASGPYTGETFDLEESTTIGSAEDADIRIKELNERHGRFVYDGETLTLSKWPGSDVFVNGEPISSRPLRSGDEIRFGDVRFVLQAPGLRPPSVLRQPGTRPVQLWTWIMMGAAAAAGVAAVVLYILNQ